MTTWITVPRPIRRGIGFGKRAVRRRVAAPPGGAVISGVVLVVGSVAFGAGSAAADGCNEITLAQDDASGEVAAQISGDAPTCFTFGTGDGQEARLQLFGSENTCFNVRGVVDCQDDFSFITTERSYAVDVNQLFPGPDYEEVVLRLTIR